MSAVACTVLDGRPVAITGSFDRTVRVWDLARCAGIGPPLPAIDLYGLAITADSGILVMVGADIAAVDLTQLPQTDRWLKREHLDAEQRSRSSSRSTG